MSTVQQATETMIERMNQIEKLLEQGGKTVEQLVAAMHLSQASIRRYLSMMEDDGEVHVGDWEGEGREATAVYMLGKGEGAQRRKRSSTARPKPAPEARPSLSFAADPLMGGLFAYRRAA